VPAAVVIVIVPLTLFYVTCRLTGALHLQWVSMLVSATEMLASSLARSPSSFAIIRVAKTFLLAGLAFLDFGSPTVFHPWESFFDSIVTPRSFDIFCWG